MAYKFVEKKKMTQEEVAYIVYMIVGSYFNKVTCKNIFIEESLYLHYMDMKEKAQETKEQRIIQQAEKSLKGYRKVLEKMNCEVVISSRNNRYNLDFLTGFERIHAEVDIKGNCDISVIAA